MTLVSVKPTARRLFYVMGASGAGKDAVMSAARRALPSHLSVVFAHRYIARPFDAGGENFISLSPSEFALRQSAHLFWLTWQSHGLHYGIGREVLLWLSSGVDVVVNGSRAYLPQAQALATQENVSLIPVWIHCDRDILADRLMRRGRESASDIAERLAAADRYVMPDHAVVIDNSQALASSTAVFLALFQDAHDAD